MNVRRKIQVRTELLYSLYRENSGSDFAVNISNELAFDIQSQFRFQIRFQIQSDLQTRIGYLRGTLNESIDPSN